MQTNRQFSADLFTFTKYIFNGSFIFVECLYRDLFLSYQQATLLKMNAGRCFLTLKILWDFLEKLFDEWQFRSYPFLPVKHEPDQEFEVNILMLMEYKQDSTKMQLEPRHTSIMELSVEKAFCGAFSKFHWKGNDRPYRVNHQRLSKRPSERLTRAVLLGH